MPDTRRRIVDLVCDIAQASPAEVEQANQFTQLPQWDSLMHLKLVLAIEQEFGVQFGIEDVSEIASVDDAVALLAKKTQEVSA
jgi:acyl carrier protein